MRRTARSLEDCLSADAGFARLSTHATRMLRLQRVFESATPLAHHARIANIRLGKVVIHAANGAVATKLKQIAPTLADVFRNKASEVTGLEIRVQPRPAKTLAQRPKITVGIGEKSKRGLTLLANTLPEDSPLRAALNRLVAKA